jgi:hypothetical protein
MLAENGAQYRLLFNRAITSQVGCLMTLVIAKNIASMFDERKGIKH